MPQDKKKSDRRERLAAARDRRRGESGGGGGGSRSSYTQRDLPKLPPPAPASAKAERRLSSRTVKDVHTLYEKSRTRNSIVGVSSRL